jgi:hypothetical protein
MTHRKPNQRQEKVGLQLTQAQRKLILDCVASLPEAIAQTIQATPVKQPIMMILNDWKVLAGHIASKANDLEDKQLQNKLDSILAKIQDLLDRHNAQETSVQIKQPLVEESVQLAQWAAEMLIGAEQLAIKSKPVARFPLREAERAILLRLPILSVKLKRKLAKGEPSLTVGDVGGLLIAVSEALLDAPPLQQFTLILVAKNLMKCLETEVARALKPGTEFKRTEEEEAN